MSNAATVLKDGALYKKITKELYIKHKKDGETDSRIMRRYGMHNQGIVDWKQENFTEDEIQNLKIKGKGGRPPVKQDKTQGKPVKIFDKELKQALEELADLKKENEDLAAKLALSNVEDNSELNNLKAACSDLENETITLQRKLIEKDYDISNKDYALQSLSIKMQSYQKENEALKELVRLWI